MDARSKVFIFLAAVLTACNTVGQDQAGTPEPIDLATRDLAQAVKHIDDKAQHCKAQERKIDLTPVASLGFPAEETTRALGYFHMSNYMTCIQPELGQYYSALQAVHALAPERNAQEASRLFAHEQARYYRYQADFLKLSEEHRKAFENIPALQQPFDLLTAIKALQQ